MAPLGQALALLVALVGMFLVTNVLGLRFLRRAISEAIRARRDRGTPWSGGGPRDDGGASVAGSPADHDAPRVDQRELVGAAR